MIGNQEKNRIKAHIQHQELREGAQIGLYEIKSVLNVNRYVITYSAWNYHLNTQVTLKEYFPQDYVQRSEDGYYVELISEQKRDAFEKGLHGFVERADTVVQIEHRNVVQAHNTLNENGTAYLILDYEQGELLADKLQANNRLSEQEARAIFIALLEALTAVHEQGIVHGDIHPTNILIKPEGQTMLLGMTSLYGADAPTQTLHSGFNSAELFDRQQPLPPSVDLFALGATMYNCLTLQEPVSALDRVAEMKKGKPDPLKPIQYTLSRQYSQGLLKTIDWLLSVKQENRPTDSTHVLTVLNDYFKDEQGANYLNGDQQDERPSANESKAAILPFLSGWKGFSIVTFVLLVSAFWFFNDEEGSSETISEAHELVAFDGEIEQVSTEAHLQQKDNTLSVAINDPEQLIETTVSENMAQQSTVAETFSQNVVQVSPDATHSKVEDRVVAFPETVVEPATKIHEPIKLIPDEEWHEASEANESVALAASSTEVVKQAEPAIVIEEPELTAVQRQEEVKGEPKAAVDIDIAEPTQSISSVVNAGYTDKWDTVRSLGQEKRIQWHLDAAAISFAESRLTMPIEDNAYEHYRIILVLEPNNSAALAGLQMIIEEYLKLIKTAVEVNDYIRARVYLRRAEAVSPDAPELIEMRKLVMTGNGQNR